MIPFSAATHHLYDIETNVAFECNRIFAVNSPRNAIFVANEPQYDYENVDSLTESRVHLAFEVRAGGAKLGSALCRDRFGQPQPDERSSQECEAAG